MFEHLSIALSAKIDIRVTCVDKKNNSHERVRCRKLIECKGLWHGPETKAKYGVSRIELVIA